MWSDIFFLAWVGYGSKFIKENDGIIVFAIMLAVEATKKLLAITLPVQKCFNYQNHTNQPSHIAHGGRERERERVTRNLAIQSASKPNM